MFLLVTWLYLSDNSEYSLTGQEPADGGFLLICGEAIANALAVWAVFHCFPLLDIPTVAIRLNSFRTVVEAPVR